MFRFQGIFNNSDFLIDIIPKVDMTFFIWTGSCQKEGVITVCKDLDHILDTKQRFKRSHFHYIFNDFGFLVDSTPKCNERYLHKSLCMCLGPGQEVTTCTLHLEYILGAKKILKYRQCALVENCSMYICHCGLAGRTLV